MYSKKYTFLLWFSAAAQYFRQLQVMDQCICLHASVPPGAEALLLHGHTTEACRLCMQDQGSPTKRRRLMPTSPAAHSLVQQRGLPLPQVTAAAPTPPSIVQGGQRHTSRLQVGPQPRLCLVRHPCVACRLTDAGWASDASLCSKIHCVAWRCPWCHARRGDHLAAQASYGGMVYSQRLSYSYSGRGPRSLLSVSPSDFLMPTGDSLAVPDSCKGMGRSQHSQQAFCTC